MLEQTFPWTMVSQSPQLRRRSRADGIRILVDLPAHSIVWLASPEARFLKGKTVWANWDVDELKARKEEIEAGSMLTTTMEGLSSFKYTSAGSN